MLVNSSNPKASQFQLALSLHYQFNGAGAFEAAPLLLAPPCGAGPHQARSARADPFTRIFFCGRDSLFDCFDFAKAAEDAPSRDSP